MLHEIKVRYNSVTVTGESKSVTEQYVVDAVNFTDAEATAIKIFADEIGGEFDITAIKRSKINEIIKSDYADADKWFRCKLYFFTIDEKTAKTKKEPHLLLVQAETTKQAQTLADEHMKGSVVDYTIAQVSETNIINVWTDVK